MPEQPQRGPTRRQLLTGAAVAVGAAGVGFAAGRLHEEPDQVLDPYGDHQAGVDRPQSLQQHAAIAVLDGPPDLAALSTTIAALAHDGVAGLPPARLTVTVGLGPRLADVEELPAFRRDDLSPDRTGGDVLLLIRSDDPVVAALARTALVDQAGGTLRWSVDGFRGPLDGPAPRNLLGFQDGLSIPRTPSDVEAAVWRPDGSTTAVVRVMPIDVGRFSALSLTEQQATIGRERASGAPLSGGTALSQPDLNAKSDAGVYDIPVDAHVRRAHPLPAGLSTLMLRRSYSFSRGPADQGAVFMAFQRDLDTFVKTQLRLDESDALTAFARTTDSGSFLILPGFNAGRSLRTT